jgi:hypothetical protein
VLLNEPIVLDGTFVGMGSDSVNFIPHAAGIGTGYHKVGVAFLGNLIVRDGSFVFRSGDASTIGVGCTENGPQTIGSMEIYGGKFNI